MLAPYRKEAGFLACKQPYPSWDGTGRTCGRHSSTSAINAATGNEECRKRMEYGPYFGTWAPFYNIHKMYAGLRDAMALIAE